MRDLTASSRAFASAISAWRAQRLQLGVDQPGKIERPARGQPLDLGEAETGALQRDDLVDPLERRRAVEPAAAIGAQRRHQPARLVETQRARGQPGAAHHLPDVEQSLHESRRSA